MKKIFAVFLLSIGGHSLMAQWRRCGANEMMQQMMKKDSLLKMRIERYDEMLRQYISSRPQGRVQDDTQTTYNIRVAVHVVKDGNGGSLDGIKQVDEITDDIKEDIEDYLNNSECGNTGRIKFVVGKVNMVNASGDNAYKANGVNLYNTGGGISDLTLKAKTNKLFPPDKYLNIWVVNKIDGISGTEQNPPANASAGYGLPRSFGKDQEGVVILASTIKPYLLNPYLLAPDPTLLRHETGHFFDLKHVFYGCWKDPNDHTKGLTDCGTGECPPIGSPGDGISDTDPVLKPFPNLGPRSGPNPCCTDPNQKCLNSNYIDYTEKNIMNYNKISPCGLLTPGQEDREIASIMADHKGLIMSNETFLYEQKALSKILKQIRSVISVDPNEKVGITGNRTANHVNGVTPFSYNIYFENKNTATAPAQEVVIIDTLDKSRFDLSTFQLKSFGYGGSTKAYIPTGLTEYFVLDTLRRPGKPNLLVKTDAKLDTTKGILTWRFLSLDPQTRELVADPLDGFLPPNVTSPQGEGYVSYSVAPKTSLTHGTVIQNKAFIYFDNNAPIVTNEFLNTLDKVSPVSSVNPMPQQVYDGPTFTVQWSGSDNGAGILSYDVYYKVNGGEYKLWQYDVSLLSNVFLGQTDSTYSFFSIAKDYAGNIESAKTTAERVVTVRVYDSSNTACAGAIAKFQATPAATGFTYQWQASTGNGFTDISNDSIYSGVTTTELTLTTPPTGFTNYQYRCKISNGTVTYYSSKHALRFVSTWTGTTSTAWETPANWSCGVVPDENTHVIIPNAVPHNPIVNVNGTCRSLTVNSASSIQVKSGVILRITGKLNN